MPTTNKVTDPEDSAETRKSVCPRISLVPVRYTKTLHFVRHGQGFHNVAGALPRWPAPHVVGQAGPGEVPSAWLLPGPSRPRCSAPEPHIDKRVRGLIAGHINHDNYKLWDYADAHLTELGWQQAEQLGRHVAATRLPVDLVVVAPLQRALETAVAAFGGLHCRCLDSDSGNGCGVVGGAGDGADGPPALLLMAAQEGLEGKRVARDPVLSRGCPPFIAQELCREHIGVHPCDRRSAVSAYKERFPAVDFSLVQPDEDALWTAEHRETKDEIRRRGLAFLKWLAARPERHIAVVTHSSFLHFTLSCFGQGAAEAVQGEMHKWYDNCEMRSLVLADDSEAAAAVAAADGWHFAGGLHATGRPH